MDKSFIAENLIEALLFTHEHDLCHDLGEMLGKEIPTVKGGEWQFELTAEELHWPELESVATAKTLVTAFLEECDSTLPKDWRDYWKEDELGRQLASTLEGDGVGFWEHTDRYGDEMTKICDRLGGCGSIYIYIGDGAETYFHWERPRK